MPTLTYTPKDHGPFVVVAKGQGEIIVNEHFVAKQLKDNGVEFKKIQRITRLNQNSVKIIVDDGPTANKILKIKMNQVEIAIPTQFVYREILAFGVPTYLTEDDVKELTEVPGGAEVIKTERVMRWVREENREIPTERVKLTIRGSAIPRELFICKVVHKCSIYVRNPLFCKGCKSYGHTKKWCKNTDICTKCFKKHDGEMCEQPKSCRYCDESHQTGSRDCLETKRQWDVAYIHKKRIVVK